MLSSTHLYHTSFQNTQKYVLIIVLKTKLTVLFVFTIVKAGFFLTKFGVCLFKYKYKISQLDLVHFEAVYKSYAVLLYNQCKN